MNWGCPTFPWTARQTRSPEENCSARLASQLGGRPLRRPVHPGRTHDGLHPSDTDRLLRALQTLRNLGNTVLAVEHDEQILRAADHLVDMGPGSGARGGHILAQGSLQDIMANAESPTGTWFSERGKCQHHHAGQPPSGQLVLTHANRHNLNNITLRLPLGTLTCISGRPGPANPPWCGTASFPRLKKDLSGKKGVPRLVQGSERLSRLVVIDQSPIGKSPRSTPATATDCSIYCGPFTPNCPSPSSGATRRRASPPMSAAAAANGAWEPA